MRYLALPILIIYLPITAAEYKKPDSPRATAEPSHFDMPTIHPLNMIICDEPLVPFNRLKEYEQNATRIYFGKTDAAAICARFILKELDGKPKKDGHPCKYVPVLALNKILNKKKFTVLVYEISLATDSDGEEPEKRIERLHEQFIKQVGQEKAEEDTH